MNALPSRPTKQQLEVESTLTAALTRSLGSATLTTDTTGPRAGLARDPKTFLLDVDRIRPDEDQVRRINKDADSPEIRELARSIEQLGLLNAVDVRWRPELDLYELVAGEGRFIAVTRILKWERIPVRVIEATDDEVVWLQLHENVHRRSLHALDLAAALQRVVDQQGLTLDEIAHKLNKSKSLVQKALTISQQLTPEAAKVLGSSPQGTSLDLVYQVATIDHDKQPELAKKIVADQLTYRQVVRLATEAKQRRTPAQRARGGRPTKHSRPYRQSFKAPNGLAITITARRTRVSENDIAAALTHVLGVVKPSTKAA